jgi:hypothetical protein
MPSFATQGWERWRLPGGGHHITLVREPGYARPVLVSDPSTSRVTYFEVERAASIVDGMPVVFDPFRMPVDQLLLLHHLASRGGCIAHAAGFVLGGAGIVVPGISGAGKSTLTGLVASGLPEATLLSDERIVFRARAGGVEAWGTPWMGTARVARNLGVPLRALLFPVKASGHRIAPLSIPEAVRRLIGVVACPYFDRDEAALVLATLEKVVSTVPAFELRFARDAGVGAVIRDLVHRELRVA